MCEAKEFEEDSLAMVTPAKLLKRMRKSPWYENYFLAKIFNIQARYNCFSGVGGKSKFVPRDRRADFLVSVVDHLRRII